MAPDVDEVAVDPYVVSSHCYSILTATDQMPKLIEAEKISLNIRQ